jgi:fructan beta-fructosidase
VRFYASPDLKSWTHLSDFGPSGSVTGIWECPDLFPVPVEGQPGRNRWVLVVNVGSGQPAGGSGTQYFVGEFDGTRFVADGGKSPEAGALWADFGRDFYAGVSWSDVPARDGRRLWLGWMSNWTYANDVPTAPWRSAMSVPRELQIRSTPAGWRLIQHPVRELKSLRGSADRVRRVTLDAANAWLAQHRFPTGLAEVELTLDRVPASGSVTWECRHSGGAVTRVVADFGASEIRVDRTASGRVDFSPTFAGVHRGPLRISEGRVELHLLLDTSSIEVFAQGGETVLTDLILPPSPELRFAMTADGPGRETRIASLSLTPLKSAPPRLHPGTP